MIISGENFARIADGIYSFHIEKQKGRIIITFTDATGGEVFRIEKSVKSKNFRTDLLKELLIRELLIPNMDDNAHKYEILDIDVLIENVDENPDEIEKDLKEQDSLISKEVEILNTVYSVIENADESVMDMTLKEIFEGVKKYVETGEAPEWLKKSQA